MTAERPTRGFLGRHDGAPVPILHKPFTSEHLEEVIASVIARDDREVRVESVADGF